MLRRRILASAMASVMAIGSVAVVASAEETAASTTQAKTKADLEALVKEYDSWRSGRIYDYGSVSGEDFLNAIEYCDNVLADDESTANEYTVAYSMLVSVVNRLVIYSAEELKALIAESRPIIETNNIYNEDLGDNIYTGGSFEAFENAYDEAESVVDSSDSRIITDAYEKLYDAKNGLSKLDTVTKSQFRAAMKAYETALQKEFAYDAWRVGTVNHGQWYYNGHKATYGVVYEHVQSAEAYINGKYELLDKVKTLSVTSQQDIVDAYKACGILTDVLNGFVPDDTGRAAKANVKTLLNEYHGRLVHDFATTKAEKLYEAVVETLGDEKVHNKLKINDYVAEIKDDIDGVALGKNAWCVFNGKYKADPTGTGATWEGDKDISAEITIKVDDTFYLALDKNGYAIGTSVDGKTIKDYLDFVDTEVVERDVKFKDPEWTGTYVVYTAKADATLNDLSEGKTYNIKAGDEYVTLLGDDGVNIKVFKWDDFKAGTWGGFSGLITPAAFDANFTELMDGPAAATFKRINAKSTIDLTDYIEVKPSEVRVYDGREDASAVDNHLKNDVSDGDGANSLGSWDAYGRKTETNFVTNNFDGWYTNSSGENVRTHTYLDDAYALAMLYVNGTTAEIKANKRLILAIDTIDALSDATVTGTSAAEWNLVYRYLKYALHDKYDASSGTKTRKDIEQLVEKCYELADKTGDAAIFAANHNKLVTARQDALDWLKASYKIKSYKDNKVAVTFTSNEMYKVENSAGEYVPDDATKVSTDIYNDLKKYYDALENDYNAFKYSFAEVYDTIYDVKSEIDDGDLVATDSLAKALEDTAYYLSTVETVVAIDANKNNYDVNDNDAFSADRFFQGYNRVFTNGGDYTITIDGVTYKIDKSFKDGSAGPNISHYNLQVAYETLLAEVKAQKEPTVVLGDVDGNGVVNALDASAILKAAVNNTVIDVKVGDYNADGAVNALDASAILKFVVSQA